MTSTRKLGEIASTLDEMSDTIEEIKERVETEPDAIKKLDRLQAEMARVTEIVEESLEATPVATNAEARLEDC